MIRPPIVVLMALCIAALGAVMAWWGLSGVASGTVTPVLLWRSNEGLLEQAYMPGAFWATVAFWTIGGGAGIFLGIRLLVTRNVSSREDR